MANTLEHIREPEAKSLGTIPKRIPIVLQNNSAQSNGFVTMGPWRSEFYSMPPQDNNFVGGLDWLNMLAAHEYRHMAQFQRSMRGFNKILRIAFGQEAAAAMAYASAPQWFWEGDAVVTETVFTPIGRGRLPSFDLQFRTNLLEGRAFNYNKQYLRSYKHFIPNHYVLGYEMVSYLRKQTGNANSFANITARNWNVPFLPFAFSNSIKKEIGMSTPQLYKKMALELKGKYEEQLNNTQLTPFETITVRHNNTFTNYEYPQVLEDGSVAVLKSGIGDITQVVVLKDGRQVGKFVTGPFNESGFLSSAGNKVVWNEYRYDPRWGNRNYSVVKGFDFNSKSQNTVTSKTRYAGASLSPDGSKVLTVQTDQSYQTNLVLLNYNSGKVEKVFDNPENAFYSMARFANNGKSLVSLKTTSAGKSVVMIDITSSVETELRAPSNENIGHPVLTSEYLLYNAPYSGIDNIYALDLKSGKEFQITSAQYGAYNPFLSADGKTLYYNNQSRDGLEVVKTEFDPAKWKSKEEIKLPEFNTYQHLVEQEGNPSLFQTVPKNQYTTSRYSKLLHAVNIHSWGGYVDSDLTRTNIGITSKDILGSTQIKAGYEFDIQEETGLWKVNATFQAWYPILDFSYSYGNRSVDLGKISYLQGTDPNYDTLESNLSISWLERTAESGIRFPFNFTNSRFYTSLSLSNYLGSTKVSDFKNSIDGNGRLFPTNFPQFFLENYLDNGTLIYNSFNLEFYSLLKQATRDINSKWGIVLQTKSRNTPYGGDYSGKVFSLTSYLYLPGFFKHHSLWGYWNYQSTSIKRGRVSSAAELVDNYIFRNQIPLPRGLSDYIARSENMYSMSANYTLPVWYPDISIGPWINFKRVRANAFFDYAFGDNPELRGRQPSATSQFSYYSAGGELKFDINVLRFLPELDIGFRYSYGLKPNVTKFEVLVGTFNF